MADNTIPANQWPFLHEVMLKTWQVLNGDTPMPPTFPQEVIDNMSDNIRILYFDLLRLYDVAKGVRGEAATIEIAETQTLDTGQDASVENIGTPNDAKLVFSLPRGDKGDPGIVVPDITGLASFNMPTDDDLLFIHDHISSSLKSITYEKFVLSKNIITHPDIDDQAGRNSFDVLGVSTIPEAMQALSARKNWPAGKKFEGLQLGDYFDGLDLSGIQGQPSGTPPAAWNNTYKNNRFEIIGFNMYKNIFHNNYDTIDFGFRNNIATCKMNSGASNYRGFAASELYQWLSGNFLTALEQRLGVSLGIIHLPAEFEWNDIDSSESYKIRLPAEFEIYGFEALGEDLNKYKMMIHIPIHQKSYNRRIKKNNGAVSSYWTSTMAKGNYSSFVAMDYYNRLQNYQASVNLGVSPVFSLAI